MQTKFGRCDNNKEIQESIHIIITAATAVAAMNHSSHNKGSTATTDAVKHCRLVRLAAVHQLYATLNACTTRDSLSAALP